MTCSILLTFRSEMFWLLDSPCWFFLYEFKLVMVEVALHLINLIMHPSIDFKILTQLLHVYLMDVAIFHVASYGIFFLLAFWQNMKTPDQCSHVHAQLIRVVI